MDKARIAAGKAFKRYFAGAATRTIPIAMPLRNFSTACHPADESRLRRSSRPDFKTGIRSSVMTGGSVPAIRAAFILSSVRR
ncbi:MAG TPA: hypothetical protein VHW09_01900 [Bryobacteraceae bacterium]|nr:hypothetical protein [Bryobacteraceae bacterium]